MSILDKFFPPASSYAINNVGGDPLIGVDTSGVNTSDMVRRVHSDSEFHPKRSKVLDVIGMLGDALMMGAGKDAAYRPLRDQARIGDYMANRNLDPEYADAQIAGISPAFGEKMMDNRRAEAKDTAYEEYRQAALAQRDERDANIYRDKGRDRIAAMSNALLNTKDTTQRQAMWKAWQPLIAKTAQQYELGADTVPTEYDENWLTSAAMGGIKPYQQERLEQQDTGLNIRQQNADTASGRANVDREYKRAGVVNNAARTQIQAASLGLRAGDTVADNARGDATASERHRSNTAREGISQQNANTAAISRGAPTANTSTGGSGAPPLTPRKVNDRVRGPGGSVWISPDGKTWKKA